MLVHVVVQFPRQHMYMYMYMTCACIEGPVNMELRCTSEQRCLFPSNLLTSTMMVKKLISALQSGNTFQTNLLTCADCLYLPFPSTSPLYSTCTCIWLPYFLPMKSWTLSDHCSNANANNSLLRRPFPAPCPPSTSSVRNYGTSKYSTCILELQPLQVHV